MGVAVINCTLLIHVLKQKSKSCRSVCINISFLAGSNGNQAKPTSSKLTFLIFQSPNGMLKFAECMVERLEISLVEDMSIYLQTGRVKDSQVNFDKISPVADTNFSENGAIAITCTQHLRKFAILCC